MEENKEQIIKGEYPEVRLTISESSIQYLFETRKWTKFLSIAGFVFCGIIVIIALSAGPILSLFPSGQMNRMPSSAGFMFGAIYLFMGLIYFFPSLYLFRFSQKLKVALTFKNENELNVALSNQKSFYKFIGIFMIVILCIYGLFGSIALMATLFN